MAAAGRGLRHPDRRSAGAGAGAGLGPGGAVAARPGAEDQRPPHGAAQPDPGLPGHGPGRAGATGHGPVGADRAHLRRTDDDGPVDPGLGADRDRRGRAAGGDPHGEAGGGVRLGPFRQFRTDAGGDPGGGHSVPDHLSRHQQSLCRPPDPGQPGPLRGQIVRAQGWRRGARTAGRAAARRVGGPDERPEILGGARGELLRSPGQRRARAQPAGAALRHGAAADVGDAAAGCALPADGA